MTLSVVGQRGRGPQGPGWGRCVQGPRPWLSPTGRWCRLSGVGSGDATRRRGPSGGTVEQGAGQEAAPKKAEGEARHRRMEEGGAGEVGDGPVGGRVEIAVGICSLGVRLAGV